MKLLFGQLLEAPIGFLKIVLPCNYRYLMPLVNLPFFDLAQKLCE